MIEIGIALGLAAIFGWGISDFILKIPSEKVGAFQTAFWFRFFMFTYVLIFTLLSVFPTVTLKDIIITGIAGALILTGTLSFFRGLKVGDASLVVPLSAAYPIVVVPFAIFILGEIIGLIEALAIILIIIAAMMISIKPQGKKKISLLAGASWGISTMLLWGFGFFALALTATEIGAIHTLFIMESFMLSYLVLGSLVTKNEIKMIPNKVLIATWAGASFAIIAMMSIALSATYRTISITAPVSAAYPAITIILAAIFYRERLNHLQKLGVALIIVSLIILSV